MMQKFVVGLLILTVIGAVTIGIYDASQTDAPAGATELLAPQSDQAQPVENPINTNQTPLEQAPVAQAPGSTEQAPAPQQQATDQIGDPWQDSGMIAAFDTNGMFLTGTLAGEIYVELGPDQYWQQQPITLNVGESVSVDGFYNGEQYHAVSVTKSDGTQLVLRTPEGLPMWSGSAQNGNGNSGQGGQGEEIQLEPIDWVTFEGVIAEVQGNNVTMQTLAGETLALQLGQKNFVESQGITFAVNDEITVIGYWQADQFKAGEITKTATGERMMLLDPNGRPLWGGPGRNGEQGQSQGQADGDDASTGDSIDNQDTGTGGGNSSGQGKGNGYQGGRNS